MFPVKTTLNLPDELVGRAKALAARERTSLTRLIEEGLNLRLRAGRAPARAAERPELPLFTRGTGAQPGVDMTSNRAMLDAAGEDA